MLSRSSNYQDVETTRLSSSMVHIKVTEAYNAIIPASQPAYPIAQAIRALKLGFVNGYKPDLFAYTI